MEIRFLTGNISKIKEANEILSDYGITIIPFEEKIEELQTIDTEKLLKDKVLKAYRSVKRPVFIEHTGLYINYINELPGGLTQIFWDSLQADKFSQLFGNNNDTSASAKTVIGYCDGKKVHYFYGVVKGRISEEPRGDRTFQWDCVFIPEGYDKTFAELGEEKNSFSMRKKSLDNFAAFLKGEIK